MFAHLSHPTTLRGLKLRFISVLALSVASLIFLWFGFHFAATYVSSHLSPESAL